MVNSQQTTDNGQQSTDFGKDLLGKCVGFFVFLLCFQRLYIFENGHIKKGVY